MLAQNKYKLKSEYFKSFVKDKLLIEWENRCKKKDKQAFKANGDIEAYSCIYTDISSGFKYDCTQHI